MSKPTIQEIYQMDLPLLKPGKDDSPATKVSKLESRAALIRALEQAVYGQALPTVVLLYEKDPKGGEGRVAMEDYLPLPGMSDDTHMGVIVTIAKSAKGNIYFKLRDSSRADGISPWSWTCIRPERVRVCQYRGADVDNRPVGRLVGRLVKPPAGLASAPATESLPEDALA